MIRVERLTYLYPSASAPAVSAVSFSVSPGEIFGLLGPSGAGKTTTQRVLARLNRRLALFTPAFALLIPSVARDKVGALAIFKGLSFLTLIPLALFIVPPGAWYRPLLLISPTGWIVEAYRAFLSERAAIGLRWALGATLYAVALLVVVVHHFRGKVYRLHP